MLAVKFLLLQLMCLSSVGGAFLHNHRGLQGFINISRQQNYPIQDLISLYAEENKDKANDEVVKVGSKEYLEGFVSSPIQDPSVQERGTGLEQGLKLAGSATILLVLLLLGFMASNGIL